MGRLEGKIALVTGGNSGIGLATAMQFVKEGAYVFITGRRNVELAAAVKEIGRNVTGVQGDVSNVADLDRLFAQIKREKGKLDIVFVNAGVARYAALGAISEEFFDSIFDTNVKGVLFAVQKALPLLSDGASIMLNASMVGSKGLPAYSVYSATKAAVRSFARTWPTDLKERCMTKLAQSMVAQGDPVYGASCVGVGKGSMKWSEEELKALEIGVVGGFARGCQAGGITQFSLLSAVGSTAKSRIRYVRVMGLKEETVRGIGFQRLAIFRPGIIAGNAHTPRYVAWLGHLIPGRFGTIEQDDIARAFVAEFISSSAPNGVVYLENGAMRQRSHAFK